MDAKNISKSLLIPAIIILLGFSGSLPGEAQKQTTGRVRPQAAKTPVTIRGRIKDGPSDSKPGVPGITILLKPHFQAGQQRSKASYPTETVSDINGKYSFTLSSEFRGTRFELIPLAPGASPGQYFDPAKKAFILNRNRTFDFEFKPPSLVVWGSLKTADGQSIPNCDIILEQMVGPGPYQQVAADRGAEYSFSIDFLQLNKAFRLRVKHPQAAELGQGFTPSKKLFSAEMIQKYDFVYTGPLPDVTVTGMTVHQKPGSVNVRIKNIGGLAMGYFDVRFFYRIKNAVTSIWKSGYKDKNVHGLAAGATVDVGFSVSLLENDVLIAERVVLNNTQIRYPESSYANNIYTHKQ